MTWRAASVSVPEAAWPSAARTELAEAHRGRRPPGRREGVVARRARGRRPAGEEGRDAPSWRSPVRSAADHRVAGERHLDERRAGDPPADPWRVLERRAQVLAPERISVRHAGSGADGGGAGDASGQPTHSGIGPPWTAARGQNGPSRGRDRLGGGRDVVVARSTRPRARPGERRLLAGRRQEQRRRSPRGRPGAPRSVRSAERAPRAAAAARRRRAARRASRRAARRAAPGSGRRRAGSSSRSLWPRRTLRRAPGSRRPCRAAS